MGLKNAQWNHPEIERHAAQEVGEQAGNRIVRCRAKAFAGQPIQSHRFAVSRDGAVRVWDDAAGRYTVCHSLAASAVRRIRKLAGQ